MNANDDDDDELREMFWTRQKIEFSKKKITNKKHWTIKGCWDGANAVCVQCTYEKSHAPSSIVFYYWIICRQVFHVGFMLHRSPGLVSFLSFFWFGSASCCCCCVCAHSENNNLDFDVNTNTVYSYFFFHFT